jgi:subtilisin family serine protease
MIKKLTRVVLTLILFIFITFDSIIAERVISKGNIKYLSNQMVIKFKENVNADFTGRVFLPQTVSQKLSFMQVNDVTFFLKGLKAIENSELNRIVVVKYSSELDPLQIIPLLKQDNNIEWAEPKFVYEFNYIPNDPEYSIQWHLAKVKAAEAWDISKGDTSVVIGIVDTGVDWDHPDLATNIWRNWSEIPNNGVDDDNNGYVDDLRGWDFGGLIGIPDNDPMEDRPDHGTHVAGIASAVTDNGIGVAGLGFNCKIMPVKVSSDNNRNTSGQPYVLYGFEGIAYAAENGAKVINCSWGGGGYSIAGQTIIDYATSLGALVVGAAGNDNSSESFYPASYNNVLSVAASGTNDVKASFSNYGNSVDVISPGVSIRATWQNDTYTYLNGTSMAAPLTAGLAGLVVSYFPQLSPQQVSERIRVTSDNIDALNSGIYKNKLGKGRINAQNALSAENPKSIRITEVFVSDAQFGNNDGIFQPGELLTVRFNGKNVLTAVNNPTITLKTSSPGVSITGSSGNVSPGALATGQTFSINDGYFTVQLASVLILNLSLDLLFEINDGDYSDYQWYSTIANPTFATVNVNNVAMTVTSKGALGFNDFPQNLQGKGFKYKNSQGLFFEGAFMFGNSSTRVSDAARFLLTQSTDFQVVKPFTISSPGSIADQQGNAIFNDNGAGAGAFNIETHLNTYSYSSVEDEDYIILEYKMVNKSQTDYTNMHAGLYFDWDLPESDYENNIAAYDQVNNFGYVYNTSGASNIRSAIALISGNQYNYYAIHNYGLDGGISVNDASGYTTEEKWTTLSNGLNKIIAGKADISNVISGGPYNINKGDTLRIAFAIAAAEDSTKLPQVVTNSRAKYQQILTSVENEDVVLPERFELSQNYPNPFNPVTKIRFSIPSAMPFSNVTIKVYDLLGREIVILLNEMKQPGSYEIELDASKIGLSSGIYFYKINAGYFTDTKKLILLK